MAFIAPGIAHADAWTLPQGDRQLITTVSYLRSDHFYTESGTRLKSGQFGKTSVNPYFEYGARDWLTLGVSLQGQHYDLPDRAIQRTPLTREGNVLAADAELFARTRLWQNDRFVLSLQPSVKLPTYYRTPSGDAHDFGDAEAELAVQLGAKASAFSCDHFMTISAGFRERLGNPGNQARLNVTGGTWLNEQWLILGQVNYTAGIGESSVPDFTRLDSDDYDLLKAQLSALYRFTPGYGVQLGVFDHVYARNTGDGSGALVAFWWRF